MSNKIKNEMDKIKIPNELRQRSKMGVSQAKKEIISDNKRNIVRGIGVAVALFVSIGAFTLLKTNLNNTTNSNSPVVLEDGGVNIPAIKLPKETMNANMIGLIVYNGKIYTQTKTEITADAAKKMIDEKLGTTKGTIDEWSEQKAYDEEFASTVAKTDVYSVTGYDKDFRIMTYKEENGEIYAEFYENLNGITIKNGKDVFGKLNMNENISSAQFRTFSDWNNSIKNYQPITDLKTLNTFVVELNKAKPFPRSLDSDPIRQSRSEENFRELSIILNDGSTVRLTLLSGGYIYYGYMDVYFKMNEDIFSDFWSNLK
ncbi:hypothetical protein WAK64_14110 [Bacillus spongiae]|uniref:Uncharacterized protein n=1 Tax=Bacillus spongiae TaxID=2683610 RepID=A0ABU8HG97_9BACI